MNNVSEYIKCSNCGACYNICPTSAISLNEDDLFYTVEVNSDKCIDCGACKKICPVNNYQNKQNVISSYGGCSIDDEVVKKSSSGGAFYELAKAILADNGVVYSAAYSDDCREIVFRSTDEVLLEDLMRSKYVESKVEGAFPKIKDDLVSGREVMFCGAPCQVAGLKSYLKSDYENLLTCDFSCGGMPSHSMYKEYLSFVEKKLKSNISSVNFRPKTYGWQLYTIEISATNGKKYVKTFMEDPYFYCFVGKHISVRDYCYECEFADNHYADIILADFWKCRSASGLPDKNTGISLMITNSLKGESFIQKIRKRLVLTVLDNEKATYNLKKKSYSDEFLENRSDFISKCAENGFMNAVKGVKLKSAWKPKAKYYIKKILMNR